MNCLQAVFSISPFVVFQHSTYHPLICNKKNIQGKKKLKKKKSLFKSFKLYIGEPDTDGKLSPHCTILSLDSALHYSACPLCFPGLSLAPVTINHEVSKIQLALKVKQNNSCLH